MKSTQICSGTNSIAKYSCFVALKQGENSIRFYNPNNNSMGIDRIALAKETEESAKGYQLQYAVSKKFKKAKTIKTGKTKYVWKKGKKRKIYYVRVRAYVVNGKKTVYSNWSKVVKAVRRK